MSLDIIETGDGSHTIYDTILNETYHSKHGAIQESNHVYINEGLKYWVESNRPDNVKIFEMGFGTGLNVLLAVKFAVENKIDITYHCIEIAPLPGEIIKKLNYSSLIDISGCDEIYQSIHSSSWARSNTITKNFKLKKFKSDISLFKEEETYDVVFYDAFAPSKQADVWDMKILKKVKDMMNPKSILTTYCSQGQFKRNLKLLDFRVEPLAGPPGKSEMVRATLS